MYVPRSFRVQDPQKLAAFMRRFSFATLLTPVADAVAITHLPLLLDTRDAARGWRLRGHVARANDHWRQLGAATSTAAFQGPHGYISPAWYADSGEVPTWNYTVVHASGPVTLIEEAAELAALVDELTDVYEMQHGDRWDRVLPVDYRQRLLQHIVGFELRVEHLEGKFKLGQNRSRDDQDAMQAALAAEPDADSQALAGFIASLRDAD